MASSGAQQLANSLREVRRKILQIRSRKESIGESNTKAVLIDPVLVALGWDLGDLDEVRREYRRNSRDNPVDYALFLIRTPRLFVEAKAVGTDLGDRKWISQVLGYATVVGVEWCVLTDGDDYRIYNAHAAVDVEKKMLRTVRISDVQAEKHCLETLGLLSKDKVGENQLEVLWKAHSVDRYVEAALDDILKGEDSGLARLVRKKAPNLTPSEIRDSLRRANIQVDFPMVGAESTGGPPKPPPDVGLGDLVRENIIELPMDIERKYRGTELRATVQGDQEIVFDGNTYRSLSSAAVAARESVTGKRFNTSGWDFWRFRNASGELKTLKSLRGRRPTRG